MVNTVPYIPYSNVADGTQVADSNGSIYEFVAKQNKWIYRGTIDTLNVVSNDSDGVITPDIYRKLSLLIELIDNGYDFNRFKLDSNTGYPYFYLFNSSDRLIKFTIDSKNKLRIEIDRDKLYHLIANRCCVGPKGFTGPKGVAGRNGEPAPNEQYQYFIENSAGFSFSKVVNHPLEDQPLSFRVFDDDEQIAEVLIYTDFSSTDNAISHYELSGDISIIKLYYDVDSFELSGMVDFNYDYNNLRYKVRQRGPKGNSGSDGDSFLEIVNNIVDDPSIYSNEAIVSLRKTGLNSISLLSVPMFETISTSSLGATSGVFPPQNLLDANFVGVEVTTRNSKDIGYTNINDSLERGISVPDLDLPSWTPPSGCGQSSRWGSFRFNWWDFTDTPYVFRIIPTSKPPELCCSSDFFWCPNVGDQPCGVRGNFGLEPTLEVPKKFLNECICGCENPIEFELQSGGYYFNPINAATDSFDNSGFIGDSIISVMDGSNDKYTADLTIKGKVQIQVFIQPYSEVCGGESNERSDCAYSDSNKIHSFSTIQDLTGNTRFLSSQVVEVEDFPGSIEYLAETSKSFGDGEYTESLVRLSISVNNTGVNLCRGYIVIVNVRRDLIEDNVSSSSTKTAVPVIVSNVYDESNEPEEPNEPDAPQDSILNLNLNDSMNTVIL